MCSGTDFPPNSTGSIYPKDAIESKLQLHKTKLHLLNCLLSQNQTNVLLFFKKKNSFKYQLFLHYRIIHNSL